jgi:hypothetical protein
MYLKNIIIQLICLEQRIATIRIESIILLLLSFGWKMPRKKRGGCGLEFDYVPTSFSYQGGDY